MSETGSRAAVHAWLETLQSPSVDPLTRRLARTAGTDIIRWLASEDVAGHQAGAVMQALARVAALTAVSAGETMALRTSGVCTREAAISEFLTQLQADIEVLLRTRDSSTLAPSVQ